MGLTAYIYIDLYTCGISQKIMRGEFDMKAELNQVSGLVDEKELEVLAGNEDVKGGWTPVATVIIGGIGLTMNATPCPTSACTKSCNK